MAGLLFVSQAMLDSWAEQGKIDFVGNVMTLLVGDGKGRSYALEPAVRFMNVVGADSDPHALIAKVKTTDQLRQMHADQVGDSVVLGDVGYEVQSGFLAEVSAIQAAAAAQKNPGVRADGAAPAKVVMPMMALAPAQIVGSGSAAKVPEERRVRQVPLPPGLEERRKEAEALARFILDNLM